MQKCLQRKWANVPRGSNKTPRPLPFQERKGSPHDHCAGSQTRGLFSNPRQCNNLELCCACRWHRCRYSQRKETSVRPRFLLALIYRVGKPNLNYNRNYEISFRLRVTQARRPPLPFSAVSSPARPQPHAQVSMSAVARFSGAPPLLPRCIPPWLPGHPAVAALFGHSCRRAPKAFE